jgi:hypothetical protein
VTQVLGQLAPIERRSQVFAERGVTLLPGGPPPEQRMDRRPDSLRIAAKAFGEGVASSVQLEPWRLFQSKPIELAEERMRWLASAQALEAGAARVEHLADDVRHAMGLHSCRADGTEPQSVDHISSKQACELVLGQGANAQ